MSFGTPWAAHAARWVLRHTPERTGKRALGFVTGSLCHGVTRSLSLPPCQCTPDRAGGEVLAVVVPASPPLTPPQRGGGGGESKEGK